MLTGFDDCCQVQDNDFEWLWQTSFQDNIHWGFWWALQQPQRVLLGYSLHRWTHQRRPWVRVVSGVRHWCWLLLTLVLELKTYLFPLFSLEGWNVEAKVAQFENYVKDHLRFYKDQVRTDTTIKLKLCQDHFSKPDSWQVCSTGPHHVHNGGRLPVSECCHELQKHGQGGIYYQHIAPC